MPQDLLPIWKAEFLNLSKSEKTTAQAMQNLANYVAARVGSLQLAPPFVGSAQFTFVMPAFLGPLLSLQATKDPTSGPQGFASAFQAGVSASQMVVSSGFIGAPAPPTLFSAPPVCMINAGALTAAKTALMAGLLALKPSDGPSQIPQLLYTAFASLAYDLIGINSIVPTPTPLLAPMTPVI